MVEASESSSVVSSCWSSWLPCSAIMSLTTGLSTWSSGFAAWVENSAWPQTWMVPISCWQASVLSLSLRLRWLSLLNTPSPEQDGLVENPEKKRIDKTVQMCYNECRYAGYCIQYTGFRFSRTLSAQSLAIAAPTTLYSG
jgi:hypothetical protein